MSEALGQSAEYPFHSLIFRQICARHPKLEKIFLFLNQIKIYLFMPQIKKRLGGAKFNTEVAQKTYETIYFAARVNNERDDVPWYMQSPTLF